MKPKKLEMLVRVLLLLVSVFIIFALVGFSPETERDAHPFQGITNFDRLYLKYNSTGPILNVNQQGTGDVVRFQDDGTTVWAVADGGDVTTTGDLANNGKMVIDGTSDEIQLTVQGYTTQTSNLFVLENSSATDQFVVDGSGNVTTMGDIDEAIIIDGEADAVQLTVQGYTTQTAKTFVVEQSDGTDKFTVSDEGNILVMGASDLRGSLVDGAGTFVIADNVAIIPVADAEQLVITGYTTQTNSLFVIEASDGTDIFEVGSSSANLNNNPLVNIGAAGTDFGSDGSLTTAQTVTVSAGGVDVTGDSSINGTLDMSNNAISNIGNAGTDFGSDGSLTTAQTVTVSAGGVAVTGDSSINGTLDMSNNPIENIGVAGTDFGSDGSLTTAQTVTVSTGGINVTGDAVFNGAADADATSYNQWVTVEGEATGTGTKDRNYPLVIEMTRPAGQEIGNGDHDEAGLKIRVDTEAVTTTSGTVLRAIDAEAKADNPGGTVTNLYGAALTAKSDTSAGDVGTMCALTTNVQNNEAVNDALMSADFRVMRQAATEPTEEYVVRVRNSSTSGAGADAGIYITSDYSDTLATDDMDYAIDMDTADVTTADIRLHNAETIANTEDGTITVTVAASGRFAVADGNLTVGSGSPSLTLNGGDAYVAGTLESDGAARFDAGAMVAGGNLEISNGLFLPMFDDLTINDGDWLTSTTVTVYALDTSGEVTMTLGACAYDGQSLTLIGDDANNININYINLRNTTGAALILTQYDVLGLVCQDTEWLELYLSVNQ